MILHIAASASGDKKVCSLMWIIALLLQAASLPTAATEPDAAKMSLKEIKAFNATVASDSPHFITCRKVEKTGSLVKRGHVCRTAKRWQQLDDNGNRQARTLVEESTTRPGGQ